MPSIKELHARDTCAHITFPLCALGARAQKYTTFLCTPGLEPALARLSSLTCTHRTHTSLVGGTRGDHGWNSASHAAYPPDLNMIIANALAGRIALCSAQIRSDGSNDPTPPATRARKSGHAPSANAPMTT
eukprot:2707666-Pleurochrysis_carterae.AAC.1